jgi:hypothetical protein
MQENQAQAEKAAKAAAKAKKELINISQNQDSKPTPVHKTAISGIDPKLLAEIKEKYPEL